MSNFRNTNETDPHSLSTDESQLQEALRPSCFEAYVGQKDEVDNIKVFVQAAHVRNDSLCHLLLSGPPGLGKTTLAYICAHELDVNIHVTSGPAIEKKGDLAGLLTSLENRDILFIDEIHRLNPVIEENLYPAMEDFQFDIIIGEGPHARSLKLDLPKFTLIGATTRAGLLTSPLRDRFGYVSRLNYYHNEDLALIVQRSARLMNLKIDKQAIHELASRSRGTPRIANRLLARLRDFANVHNVEAINKKLASETLTKLKIDHMGFDKMDQLYMLTLIKTFDGGPVGIDTLAAATGEHKNSLEDLYEPYLLQQGFIQRTPRGRIATPRAYQHFNIPYKNNLNPQNSLF